jgi:hypothetical protein
MTLLVKNPENEQLLHEIIQLTGQSPNEAIYQTFSFLHTQVWPILPPVVRGKPFSKAEEEAILEHGVICNESACQHSSLQLTAKSL